MSAEYSPCQPMPPDERRLRQNELRAVALAEASTPTNHLTRTLAKAVVDTALYDIRFRICCHHCNINGKTRKHEKGCVYLKALAVLK